MVLSLWGLNQGLWLQAWEIFLNGKPLIEYWLYCGAYGVPLATCAIVISCGKYTYYIQCFIHLASSRIKVKGLMYKVKMCAMKTRSRTNTSDTSMFSLLVTRWGGISNETHEWQILSVRSRSRFSWQMPLWQNDAGFASVTTQTKDKWMSRIHWEDLDEHEVVLP